MLEVDARLAVCFRRKDDFDFAGFGEIRFILPLRTDHPGHHKAPRRIPDGDLPPRAILAVDLLRIAAAADPPFDNRPRHGRTADMMAARPPGIEASGKYFEGALNAGS